MIKLSDAKCKSKVSYTEDTIPQIVILTGIVLVKTKKIDFYDTARRRHHGISGG